MGELASEPFAQLAAARLEEARLTAVEGRVEAGLALGQHAALVGELEALVAEHPLREALRAKLMLAMYRSGRQADALAAYQQLRRILDRELGLEPSPELHRLEEAILLQKSELDWVPPAAEPVAARPAGTLPAPTTDLVGRDRELGDVVRLLSGTRLLTLTGPGGIGKTRLAAAAAERATPAYPDGVVFAGLAPVADGALLLPTVLRALAVPETAERSALDAVAGHIGDGRLLLVLDNLEHLLPAVTLLGELLQRCPNASVLATSRTPLHLYGERRYPVPPLALAGDGDPAASAAVELFVRRAQAVDPGFDLTRDNTSELGAICRALDGLPLAIELAAARVDALAPHEIKARLEHRLDLLTGGARDLLDRQRTMRGAIDWSYALLPAAAQRLFARFGVFAGGATADAIGVVAGEAVPHPADALAALVDSALVLRIRSGADARFDVLETFRAYALERLVSAGEVADVRRRHALHYLDVAERDRPPLGHTDIRRRAWLEPETANLRAALDWALGTEPALAGRLAAALWRWWLDSGRAVEGLGWVDRVLAAPGGPAGVTRAEVLLARGNLGMNVNRYRSAGEDFPEAQAIWNRLGETAGEAQALFGLASAWYRQERAVEAAGLARRAGALAKRAGDHACEVRTLALLGAVAEGKGDAPAAKALYARALRRPHAGVRARHRTLRRSARHGDVGGGRRHRGGGAGGGGGDGRTGQRLAGRTALRPHAERRDRARAPRPAVRRGPVSGGAHGLP